MQEPAICGLPSARIGGEVVAVLGLFTTGSSGSNATLNISGLTLSVDGELLELQVTRALMRTEQVTGEFQSSVTSGLLHVPIYSSQAYCIILYRSCRPFSRQRLRIAWTHG